MTILRKYAKRMAARESGSRYQTPHQAIAVAADALNRVRTIHVLDFSTQAADGFFQRPRVVEIGIEPHDAGDFIMAENVIAGLRKGFQDLHLGKRDVEFMAGAAQQADARRVECEVDIPLPFFTVEELTEQLVALVGKGVELDTEVGPGQEILDLVERAATGNDRANDRLQVIGAQVLDQRKIVFQRLRSVDNDEDGSIRTRKFIVLK